MKQHPLSRCAASPSLAAREGDGNFAAGRPLLVASELGHASFRVATWVGEVKSNGDLRLADRFFLGE